MLRGKRPHSAPRLAYSNYAIEELDEELEAKSCCRKCCNCIGNNVLALLTILGVILGAGIGILLKMIFGHFTPREVMYIGYVGDIFLRMLKCLIIPLFVSSLISAIASLDLSISKRIAARCLAFYVTTTFAAVLLGMSLVYIIQPGKHMFAEESPPDLHKENVLTIDTLLDLVRNLFPPNVILACIKQDHTILARPENVSAKIQNDLYLWEINQESVSQTNILGLVMISIVVGVALASLRENGIHIANVFHNLMCLSMKITHWLIWFSPVGVLFLVMSKVAATEDMISTLTQLGLYFCTVVVGLLIQALIVLPFLFVLLTKQNPFTFIANIGHALATAFGTASSSATLPISIKCLEEKCGIDPRVVRFALPIGAAINMDGTALYEAVAAIFIAQVRNLTLTLGTYFAISITATAASIGAAGIPHAGLVTMIMVLDTIGLPAEDISIILTVDWLLDRCRTTVNVLGDSVGAAIVYYRSRKELEARV